MPRARRRRARTWRDRRVVESVHGTTSASRHTSRSWLLPPSPTASSRSPRTTGAESARVPHPNPSIASPPMSAPLRGRADERRRAVGGARVLSRGVGRGSPSPRLAPRRGPRPPDRGRAVGRPRRGVRRARRERSVARAHPRLRPGAVHGRVDPRVSSIRRSPRARTTWSTSASTRPSPRTRRCRSSSSRWATSTSSRVRRRRCTRTSRRPSGPRRRRPAGRGVRPAGSGGHRGRGGAGRGLAVVGAPRSVSDRRPRSCARGRGAARPGARAQPPQRGRRLRARPRRARRQRRRRRGPRRPALGVVAGFPSPVAAAQVTTLDVLHVVGALRDRQRHGRRRRRRAFADRDAAARRRHRHRRRRRRQSRRRRARARVVGAGPRRVPGTPLHLAVNRAPAARFRREEIRAEIERTVRRVDHLVARRPRASRRRHGTASWSRAGRSPPRSHRLAQAVAPARPARRFRRPR